jgi:hypothetical protein
LSPVGGPPVVTRGIVLAVLVIGVTRAVVFSRIVTWRKGDCGDDIAAVCGDNHNIIMILLYLGPNLGLTLVIIYDISTI